MDFSLNIQVSYPQLVNADSVHLTVRVVRYDAYHRERLGVCSGQLAERTPIGDSLPVYLKKNPNFKFSYDNNTATIMIGAGTGIAPYIWSNTSAGTNHNCCRVIVI